MTHGSCHEARYSSRCLLLLLRSDRRELSSDHTSLAKILHYDPLNEKEAGKEGFLNSHAKRDDKKHVAGRVSHLSFSQSPVVENVAKNDHHAYSSETDEQKEGEEKDNLKLANTRIAYI